MAYAKAFVEEESTETHGIHFQQGMHFLRRKYQKYPNKKWFFTLLLPVRV
jgi:hypothetical protein